MATQKTTIVPIANPLAVAVGDTISVDAGVLATVTSITKKSIVAPREDGEGTIRLPLEPYRFHNREPKMIITASDFTPTDSRHGGEFLRTTPAYRLNLENFAWARAVIQRHTKGESRTQLLRDILLRSALLLASAFADMNRPVAVTIRNLITTEMINSLEGEDLTDYLALTPGFMGDLEPTPGVAANAYLITDMQNNVIGVLSGSSAPLPEDVEAAFGVQPNTAFGARALMEDEVGLY